MLLRGIMDGDGCAKTNVLHQTSAVLADQYAELSYRTGGFPSIGKPHSQPGKKTSYRIERAFPETSDVTALGYWNVLGQTFIKASVYERVYYDGPVYNIEVQKDPTYVVDGVVVHNCVGSYAEQVQSGRTNIYSLRDPKNEPHVTFEMQQRGRNAHGKVAWDIQQIQGKGDTDPKPEYKAMLKTWFQALQAEQISVAFPDRDEDLDDFVFYSNLSTEDAIRAYYVEADKDYGLEKQPPKPSYFVNAYETLISRLGAHYSNEPGAAYDVGTAMAEVALRFDQESGIPLEKGWSIFADGTDDPTAAQYRKTSFVYALTQIADTVARRDKERVWEWVADNSPPMPDRSDFRTTKEYQQAEKEYEEAHGELETEAAREVSTIQGENGVWNVLNPFFANARGKKKRK
jgi:hypothetical protein